jgi:rod shape-determining protein MreC
MSDEAVPVGEQVLTSGGDRIFPKGLVVGRVTKVSPGKDLFLDIRVKPAANLWQLEEVLVVTRIDEKQSEPDQAGTARAADILAARLPSVPAKPPEAPAATGSSAANPASSAGSAVKPEDALKPKAAGSTADAGKPPVKKPAATASTPAGTKPIATTPSPTAPAASASSPSAPAVKPAEKPVKADAAKPPAKDPPQ